MNIAITYRALVVPAQVARPTEADLLSYKPFVDGLRAVSIIAVVGSHVGVPGFEGGFIGVDVFFVISGFLIINQIIAGLREGTFSFANFWAKRALRILPPFLVVLAACLLAAPFVLVMPAEYVDLGRQASASAVMLANEHFLSQQGYFDTSAKLKPLLNMWSLAVEEQFYLIAPLLLAGLWLLDSRWGREGRRLLWLSTIAVIFLASLIGCIAYTVPLHNVSFYRTPLRAWEFVVGGAIGALVPLVVRMPAIVSGALASAGLAAIIWSAATFTPAWPYPSYWPLVPVFGAGLLILGGLANANGAAVRLLATPPMVFIGLISYAWYLWHWPLLAFGRIYNFGTEEWSFDLKMALVSLLLAVLTYFCIERPVLKWRRSSRALGWRPVIIGVAASALVAMAGLAMANVVAAKIQPAPKIKDSYRNADICVLEGYNGRVDRCLREKPIKRFGLFMGDSQARAAYVAIQEAAQAGEAMMLMYWGPGCPPLLETTVFDKGNVADTACQKLRQDQFKRAAQSVEKFDFAVLVARWGFYLGDEKTFSRTLSIGEAVPSPMSNHLEALRNRLIVTIERLLDKDIGRVLILGPVPEVPRSPPECVRRSDLNGWSRDTWCSVQRHSVDSSARRQLVAMMASVASWFPQVRFIDPIDAFCDEAGVCRVYNGKDVYLADSNHLTKAGTQAIYKSFQREFDWVLRGDDGKGIGLR